MNEITSSEFVYSLVDDNTASFLMEKEDTLVGIHNRYSIEVGKVLYEAKEKLANNYRGTFEKWYTALGFKTTNVYSYINAYEYTLELESSSKFEELEIFKQQPKSLQNEMSKPSADPELNQKVYDGDITTNKEYKELEKKLKEKDTQLERAKRSEQIAIDKLEEEQNKEPEVIREQVEPDDYNYLKRSNEQLKNQLSAIEERNYKMANEIKEHETDSEKYKELNQAIREMQGKMDRTQKLIQAQKQVYELVDMSKELLMKITPIPYLIDSELVRENPVAKRELENIANQTQSFLNNLNDALKESRIMEGEFTNAE